MMRAIAIDFAPARRRPPAAGAALLAAALAIAAGLAWHYRALQRDIERIEAQIESLQPPSLRRAAAPVSAEVRAEVARVSQVVRQLQTPWNDLFAAIEGAVGDNVALLGVQPEPAAARVTLTAEARNYGEALWFAQRLSAGGTLADAFLTGHELRRDGSQRPVRFTISARWVALEGAAGPAGEAAAGGASQ